jgi:putative FmdB family regulatory protein
MPIYEYVCDADGDRVELMRPMADADKPVEDPAGKGRVFKRTLSVFAAQGGSPGTGKGSGHVHTGGCCPCGKPGGGCGG